MALFQKKVGPVFLKEDSDAEAFIEKMTELSTRAEGKLKQEIEKQIKLASFGLVGEKNIAYELKNCDIDMYIIHDICLECNDLQAQIDYMIFTKKRIYVLECKNLIGNIEIDNGGNFIRIYEMFGKKVKEGLYSPITQNERHKLVVKNLRMQEKKFIAKLIFEKSFDETYKSVVVLSNPKTLLNAKYAKKEVKNQVIRADQLVAYIKEMDAQIKDYSYSLDDIHNLAQYFLDKNMKTRSDYSKKYEELLECVQETTNVGEEISRGEDYDNVEIENEIGRKEDVVSENIEEVAERPCPRCGANLVLRIAKKGNNVGNHFWGCSAFPKCRYYEDTQANVQDIEDEEIVEEVEKKEEVKTDVSVEGEMTEKICPRCGGKLVLRMAKKGENSGNQFWGCGSFPKCRYIESTLE